jgi:aryl-alcohol dehydrogenase-like predicted oxidoreductase
MEPRAFAGRIALGTVQFGLDYGVSNRGGRVDDAVAAAIVERAARSGVDTLDTAVAYGCSEQVLGGIVAAAPLRIVSKFPAGTTGAQLPSVLEGSLSRLRRRSLHAWLAHDFKSLADPELRAALDRARSDGRVDRIGASIYEPADIDWLRAQGAALDFVQLPFNLFDQRFKPVLAGLKARGVEVHARSAFLQGLFFLPLDELSAHFDSVKPALRALHELAAREAIPLGALLLNYATLQAPIDKVVIGVTTVGELAQNLDAARYAERCRALLPQLDAFACADENIILPTRWKRA